MPQPPATVLARPRLPGPPYRDVNFQETRRNAHPGLARRAHFWYSLPRRHLLRVSGERRNRICRALARQGREVVEFINGDDLEQRKQGRW